MGSVVSYYYDGSKFSELLEEKFPSSAFEGVSIDEYSEDKVNEMMETLSEVLLNPKSKIMELPERTRENITCLSEKVREQIMSLFDDEDLLLYGHGGNAKEILETGKMYCHYNSIPSHFLPLSQTNESLDNIGFIAHCPNCLHREYSYGYAPHLPECCPECGEKYDIAGPLWLGSIWDKDFIKRTMDSLVELKLNKKDEVLKLLGQCYDEAEGPVSFYDIHKICKKLKISSPKINDVMDEIANRGYFISRTHFKLTGMRTDMPLDELKQLIKDIKEEKLGSEN